MYILGINAYHGDSSACLFKNERLVFAIEEERITRIKHQAGLPLNAIEACLNFENISIDQLNYITINRNPKQRFFHKLFYALKNISRYNFFSDRLNNLSNILNIENELEKKFGKFKKGKTVFIDHHDSHVASSVFFSQFKESNFLSIDGFGDFRSTVLGYFKQNKFKKIDDVCYPHSLGILYSAITQFLGFENYGDEYKLMGLSSYGSPIFYDELNNLLINNQKLFKLNLKYFSHHRSRSDLTWINSNPRIEKLYSNELFNLLGDARNYNDTITQRHKDIAASLQLLYEENLFKILNYLYTKSKIKNLCLSGGCALNSVANGKIKENTPYQNIYINFAPGDSGGSIGSAAFYINKLNNNNIFFNDNPYLGERYTDEKIGKIIETNEYVLKNKNIVVQKFENTDLLYSKIAKEIFKNKIVGFFNGRMEFGSRALGNRSILANPAEKNIRDIINTKIKRRESFRPFAPSILEEYVGDWFEKSDKVPFMSIVQKIKDDKREIIPSVTHIDGTGRLQSVSLKSNPDFYMLIKKFHEISNIPILLNTSFNENEPIVNRPEEALDCFLRTNMDILILNTYLISRSE